MPQMSLRDTRVQDPVLTTIVHGYVQSEYVGTHLFPIVEVGKRTGKIIRFDKEDFALKDTRRVPGAPTRRQSIRYGADEYSLFQDAIEGELPIEHIEESSDLPLDLKAETATSAKGALDLRMESDQAAIATNAVLYDTAHKIEPVAQQKWSYRPSVATDTVPDPVEHVNAWKEAIRMSSGVYPNSAVIGPKVFNALDRHPVVRDQFKYTSDNSLTVEMLARLFNLTRGVKVGTAVKMNDATGELEDVWGNHMVLAYVPPQIRSRRQPSYGYTYQLKGYPIAEAPYYDQNHRSWYFPVIAERTPLQTAMKAGFLAKNIVD
jgi:hypothetical protein